MGARRKIAYEVNGKPVPAEVGHAVSVEASRSLRDRRELRLREEQSARLARARFRYEAPERNSIRRLADVVERRLVSALWTLSRLPSGARGGSCGLNYIHTKEEIFAAAVDRGGFARPSMGSPTPKEIDAMHEPLSWLEWLPRDLAAIVRSAAESKEGREETNIAWGKVRAQVPSAAGLTVRTLQRRYDSGLHMMASELSFRGRKV